MKSTSERQQGILPSGPASRIGEELNGKWTLLRLLGVGGGGAVYEAVHRNGRRSAVKILSERRIRDLPTRELAAHESALANAVAHPGVVTILDDDVAEDGSVYLVMELLEGETLGERQERNGGYIALAEALPLFEQVLDVLAAAHERGIVHRDLKPDNVFVTNEGRVKVLDFGLATVARDQTKDAPWFGTPGFMPPEQARAEWQLVDARSDLWAAAATFYTVLTGTLVHSQRTIGGLVRAAASDEVDLSALDGAAPRRFVDVLQRALATDKADRWPTARAMKCALRAAAMGAPWHPASVLRAPHASRRAPDCHSTTRVFLLENVVAEAAACGSKEEQRCHRLTCVMCPVCPKAIAPLRHAG